MSKFYDDLPVYDRLKYKIHAYYQTIWREKWVEDTDQIEEWLANFKDYQEGSDSNDKEKLNMLFLLSKFMYFGNKELRQLLISLYRDLFKYPIVSKIRKENNNSTDVKFLADEYSQELERSRFLGVGNPSESGVHMLYYFRQECKLSKDLFIDRSEIFSTKQINEITSVGLQSRRLVSSINNRDIRRYVFIDDFCGSGSQASGYLKELVENIKFENELIEVNYLMVFGTEVGIQSIRNLKLFDKVEAVYTIDESFKTFSPTSRYFNEIPDGNIEKVFAQSTAEKYGSRLFNPSLGYGDCQLLLGLFHNTPDNSLPIFWNNSSNWKPIFKRYNKIY
ncbi:phosphoribosyltransferase-like protein [Sphingobacterium siyangense]|uniref:phosphoribosyltransferase-like protein n=1 Tax=Sphingobacterium siyangense TaxID=459529 RepID=UPI003DA6B6D4